MRFLDTNVLAYAFYPNEYTEVCQRELLDGGITDTFCLAEVFHIVLNNTRSKEKAQTAIKTILKLNIEIIDIDTNIIFEAIKKINKYDLSIYDMIHYISALSNNCSSIMSFDKDFDRTEIKRVEPSS